MNNVKVVTYLDPHDPIIDRVCGKDENILHICATASLTQAMVRKYKNVISANTFIDALMAEWKDIPVKLQQTLSLSELVRKGSVYNQKNLPVTQAIRRNKGDALLAIRMLTELGVKSEDLASYSHNEYEKELAYLWNKMEDKDSIEDKYFKKIGKVSMALERPHALKRMINARLLEQYDKLKAEDKNNMFGVEREKINVNHTLILHGFYFLTSIQHKVFQTLAKAGTNIIFLQLYNPKFPSTFSFMEEVLGERGGWVPKSEWIHGSGSNRTNLDAESFAGKFENQNTKKGEITKKNITLKRYKHYYDWLTDYNNDLDNDVNVNHITTIKDEVNVRIQDFFPDKFIGEKSLVSYPAGQYLLHLHKIWNQEKKMQQVDYTMIAECFLSPWLFIDDENTGKREYASDYLSIFQYLEDYFQHNTSLKDWKQGLRTLITQIRENEFISDDIESNIEQRRFIDELINPIKKLGPFSIHENNWEKVLKFIEKIDYHVQKFFNDKEDKFTFKEYFKLLIEIVDTLPEDSDYPNEIQTKSRITNLASYYERKEGKKYHIEDIAEVIQFFISGKFEEVDERKKKVLIGSIQEVDGIIFDDNKNIHVSGLDEFSFPKIDSSIPWPLTEKTLNGLSIKYPSINAMLVREKQKHVIPRFLFYTVLSGDHDITFSWFSEREDKKDLSPSFYLRMLNIEMEEERTTKKIIDPRSQTKILAGATKDYNEIFQHFSDFAKSEMNICNRRFFYSYLTQPYSVFNTGFHYSFIYTIQLKMLNSKEQYQFIPSFKNFFPFLTHFEKIAKSVSPSTRPYLMTKRTEYGGKKYSANRSMKYLVPSINDEDKIKNKNWQKAWDNQSFKYDQGNHNLYDASPGNGCKFCPHSNICPAAVYAVDNI